MKKLNVVDAVVEVCEKRDAFFSTSLVGERRGMCVGLDDAWMESLDTTHIEMEIMDYYHPDFIFGLNNPFKDADINSCSIYNEIIGTTWAMKQSNVGLILPDSISSQALLPCAISNKQLEGAQYLAIENLLMQSLLMSIDESEFCSKQRLRATSEVAELLGIDRFIGRWYKTPKPKYDFLGYTKRDNSLKDFWGEK